MLRSARFTTKRGGTAQPAVHQSTMTGRRNLHRRLAALLALCTTAGAVAAVAQGSAMRAPARPPLVHPALWPTLKTALPPDPRLERRIDSLLARMTVEQKVGQLIQGDIGSLRPGDLRHVPLGTILNGGNSKPGGDTLAKPAAWLALANRFYIASLRATPGRQPIPTLWGTDAVHGANDVYGATIFPQNIGLGATRDPGLVRRIGAATAQEVRAVGLDWTFAPVVATVTDERWGRTYESYSADPAWVRRYARAIVLGLQGKPGTPGFLGPDHVIATPKHFIGDGGTDGVDQGNDASSETVLRDVQGPGFEAAIEAGAQTVLISFSSWQGERMLADRGLLTGVLKGRWRFDGFTIGDWNAQGEVPGCTDASCPQAIDAGADILMTPDDWKPLYRNMLEQVRSGQISQARLDGAVRRILRVKLRDHLFSEGPPASRPLAGHFGLLGSPRHRALARRAVRESLVLLKNEDHLLPLSPHERVLVAGDGANSIPMQCGGWTITWQGTGTTNQDFPHAQSIWQGIEQAVHAAGGHAELRPDGTFKRRPAVAVIVYGEHPYAEFEGDVPTLAFSPGNDADLALLRRLRAQGIPVVSIFLSGRPLWVNPELDASNAFVAAWLPGSEGGGIADVIFRKPDGDVDFDFHGKLSFPWPRTPLQFGTDTPGRPLFPIGYGLRYADNGNLRHLPEIAPLPAAAAVSTKVFFASGRTGNGWSWQPADHVAAIDKVRQEDARLLRFSGSAPRTVGITGRTAIDLSRETNGQLSLAFDYEVMMPPTAAVSVAMGCGSGCRGAVPISQTLRAAPRARWRHLDIPLACFAAAGADMRRIRIPFSIRTAGRLALGVANVRLQSGVTGPDSCKD
jgi:beta-glucosidase